MYIQECMLDKMRKRKKPFSVQKKESKELLRLKATEEKTKQGACSRMNGIKSDRDEMVWEETNKEKCCKEKYLTFVRKLYRTTEKVKLK